MKNIIGRNIIYIFITVSFAIPSCTLIGDGDLLYSLPSDFDCVELWLDAGKGVIMNEALGVVDRWNDNSNNKIQFYNYYGSSIFPYSNWYNGRDFIYFNGASSIMRSTSTINIDPNNFTIFIVAGDIGSGYLFSSMSGSPSMFYGGASITYLCYNYNNPVSGYNVYEFQVRGGSVTFLMNNIYMGQINCGSPADFSSGLNIGADSVYSNQMFMYLGDFIICDDPSNDDLKGIRAYLMDKYFSY